MIITSPFTLEFYDIDSSVFNFDISLFRIEVPFTNSIQNGKQCRSWLDGSLRAVLSGSTLFAKVYILFCRAEKVKGTVLVCRAERVKGTVHTWQFLVDLAFPRHILYCFSAIVLPEEQNLWLLVCVSPHKDPSEKGSTLQGKYFLPRTANVFFFFFFFFV